MALNHTLRLPSSPSPPSSSSSSSSSSLFQIPPSTFPLSHGPLSSPWPLLNGTAANQTIVSNNGVAVAGALILGVVFLLGVPGNLFIIWSVLARARRRSVTTLLILNLACADGSLMALTAFFVVYLVKRAWVFGGALCKVLFYLCCANMYASILLITLMSLHRLVAVVWPRRLGALTSRRTVLRVLVALWLLVLALSAPTLAFREVVDGGSGPVCVPQHKKPGYVVLQYTMETVLGFLLPYGVIMGSYVCILRKLRQTRFRRRIRSEKLILAVVITFCVFWLPYHAINMVQVAAALSPNGNMKTRLDTIWKNSRTVTSALAFISSCVNPVLYTFAGKSYIRSEGLAFMARLFEGTGLDSTSRKSRQNSRERERGCEGLGLQEKESESTTSANVSSNLKVGNQKNGK